MKKIFGVGVVVFFVLILGVSPCQPPVEERCGNGVDDDGDGLVDCDDREDCIGTPDTVIFNEFQPHPWVAVPESAQYVELRNTSSSSCVDLAGWVVQNSRQAVVLANLPNGAVIPPESFYVIAGSRDPNLNCGITAALQFNMGTSMVPEQDWFKLWDDSDQVRDFRKYVNDCPVGHSLEVWGASLHCATTEYGVEECGPGTFGTPGVENSCN